MRKILFLSLLLAISVLSFSQGNVGVGTQQPLSKLGVSGNLAVGTNYMNYSAPSEGLMVEGQVVIGDSVPIGSVPLSVYGQINGGAAYFKNTNASGQGLGSISEGTLYGVYGLSSSNNSMGAAGIFDMLGTGAIIMAMDAGSEVFRVNDGGNVGIGISAPKEKLHLVGGELSITDGFDEDEGVFIYSHQPITNNAGGRIFFKENAQDLHGFSITYNGDNTDGSILNIPLNTFAISNHENNVDGNIALAIKRNNGNVGIGIDDPTRLLHVAGDMRLEEQFYDESNSPGAAGDVLTATATGTSWVGASSLSVNDADWQISGNDMYNLNSGNVGIGISSPTQKLHIENDNANYTAYFNNSTATSSSRYGIYNVLQNTGSGSAAGYGIRNINYVSSSATSANYGIRNELSSRGSGTRYGMYNYITLTNHGGSGTIYGLYTNVVGGASATGTVYGHRINNGSLSSGTEYGLYVSGEDYNYFSGNVGLGTTAPAAILEVDLSSSSATDGGETLQLDGPNGNLNFGTHNDYMWMQSFNSKPLAINPLGNNVGIGLTSPSYHLHVDGRIKSDGITESSDRRLKHRIGEIEDALGIIESLEGVTYHWKKEVLNRKSLEDRKQIGLIAQDVEKVIPEIVDTDNDGYKSIQYSHMVPVLIEAVKKLSSENKELKQSLDEQKAELREVNDLLNDWKSEQERTSDR